MPTVDTRWLSQMKQEDPGGFLLINVLEPQAFQKEHIPDSINIPLSNRQFVERVRDRVDSPNEPVVVYCASKTCDASPKAARRLEDAGFTNVYDYEAGWAERQSGRIP
jgi:rhodanese-related sulfurtransferase